MDQKVSKVIYKIQQCIDYNSIYALEPKFNEIGLSIQTTAGNRMILCRLQDGKPKTESIIDDYIFVGSLATTNHELSERATDKICDFVQTNAGKASQPEDMARVWRNGLRMYDSTIAIVNEDVHHIAGELLDG